MNGPRSRVPRMGPGSHISGMSLQAACNFIKKETLAQVFSCEFCEISKNTFFTEHIWMTAYVIFFTRVIVKPI